MTNEPTQEPDEVECSKCGEGLDEGADIDGDTFCTDCAPRCHQCNERVHPDKFRTDGYRTYCEDCGSTCEDCGSMVDDDDTLSAGCNIYCDECASNCDDCGRASRNADLREVYDPSKGYHDNLCGGCWCYCSRCGETLIPMDMDRCGDCRNCCDEQGTEFWTPNNGHGPLRNDTSVSVALPSGTISDEGLNEIQDAIRSHYHHRHHDHYTLLLRTNGSDPDKKVRHDEGLMKMGEDYRGACVVANKVEDMDRRWQTKEGNFTKRLSRMAYKEKGLKLPPEVISRVGNIANSHSQGAEYQIEFTRHLNEAPEDFAHEGSCWWGSYSESRCALKSNGGFALRSFSQRGGVTGRAWVLPLKEVGESLTPTTNALTPDAYIVFNGYGDMDGYVPARIMAHLAGLTYRRIPISIEPMYLNTGMNYLVGSEEIVSRHKEILLDLEQHSHLYSTESQVPMIKENING